MATIVERCDAAGESLVVICDSTPPRSGDPSALEPLRALEVDFVSVAYNPGRLVRADSAAVASLVKERLGLDAVFSIATRDMNRLALASRLLGARMLGLENVVVLRGDPFEGREQARQVDDITPTGLIRDIRSMNEGLDYRGGRLRSPAGLCVGATVDLGRDLEAEVRLTAKKVEAGAQFFITQPLSGPRLREQFLERRHAFAGEPLSTPVFWGLQVPVRDGFTLAPLPSAVQEELDRGRPGAEIAAEQLVGLLEAGIRRVYLVPPILRGGARDYTAAQQALALARRAAGV